DFEGHFAGRLLVATGTDKGGIKQLWVVPSNLLNTTFEAPTYFAPLPLSNQLQTAKGILVPDYSTADGTAKPEDVVDADIDAYARQFIATLESFLSPEFLVPARRAMAEVSKGTLVDALVSAKQVIANAFAERVTKLYPE